MISILLLLTGFLSSFNYLLQLLNEVNSQSHQYINIKTSRWHPRVNPAMGTIKLELLFLLLLENFT